MVVKGLCYKVIDYFKKNCVPLNEMYFNSIMDIIYERHKSELDFENWEVTAKEILNKIKENKEEFDDYANDKWQTGMFYIFGCYKKLHGKDAYNILYETKFANADEKERKEWYWILFYL